MTLCPPDLEECVAAIEDCCEEIREAQKLLRNGTRDHPRMMKILKNERVFLLVNEDTIRKFKADLADEVEPTIIEFMERAEDGLRALEKKEALLKSKLEHAHAQPNLHGTQKMEARRWQLLKKQRERLENDVRVLEEEIVLLEAKATKRRKL